MKMIVSSRGNVWVDEVPTPLCGPKEILVQNIASVISSGTERDSIDLRKKNAWSILKDRPDLKSKAKKLMNKEGLIKAYKIGMEILKEPISLGYSCAGIVVEVGNQVSKISVGDHVACMGLGANHAEFVVVTENLCAKLPQHVSFKQGAFGTLGAIAMQGVRRADVVVGENVGVIGLGLIGVITVQILKASGCTVVGFDVNDSKIDFSMKYCNGAYNIKNLDMTSIKNVFTQGHGFDKILLTAGSSSNDPIILALDLIRKKGKIVLVGRTPIEIPRDIFYEKEADFLISTSYGPGRYDSEFEEKGRYMPLEYVRWNEKENLLSFVKLISEKKIDVESLISKEFIIDEADKAYELLNTDANMFGLLITYAQQVTSDPVLVLSSVNKKEVQKDVISVGLIGVGSFAKSYLLPNFSKITEFRLRALCSNNSYKIKHIGEKYAVRYITTDYNKILDDEDIDLVVISTRHDSHAALAIESLKKNKHTFVEKPLAIHAKDLGTVISTAKKSSGQLFLGFNRRFAPFTEMIRQEIAAIPGPKSINYSVKSDTLPFDHWALDPEKGGGRIIGEMIHFIDYLNYFINTEVNEISTYQINRGNHKMKTIDDVDVTLKYNDGSVGHILYSSLGAESFPKEQVQIHVGSKSFIIDDFKTLQGYSNRIKKISLRRQDKGHFGELQKVQEALKSKNVLFDLDQIYLDHHIAFCILDEINGNK